MLMQRYLNYHGISFEEQRANPTAHLECIFVRTGRYIVTLALTESAPLVWVGFRSALWWH
jgi:hypothetical protein